MQQLHLAAWRLRLFTHSCLSRNLRWAKESWLTIWVPHLRCESARGRRLRVI